MSPTLVKPGYRPQRVFRTCTLCDRPYLAKGFCSLHWQRAKRGWDMTRPPRGIFGSGYAQGWINSNGYREICGPDGQIVLEHRYRMERHLGRKLTVDECVHHRNGNKTDNRLENLEVVERGQHTSLHRPKRKPCRVCGADDPHQARGLCGKHYMQWRRAGCPSL